MTIVMLAIDSGKERILVRGYATRVGGNLSNTKVATVKLTTHNMGYFGE
jgi:hypothetical protein